MAGLVSLCLLFTIVQVGYCKPSDPQVTKWYDVDMDSPADTRWSKVLNDYTQFVPNLLATIRQLVPVEVIPIAELIADDIENLIPSPFAEELLAVADGFGMLPGDTIALNILYDLTAYCTSIVAQDEDGVIWHARNLDYYYGDLLRNMTINVNFQRNNKTAYTGTTYAGYVGLVSGQRPNNFTITVDQRGHHVHVGHWWQNILMAILDKKTSFVSFLVRQVLDTNTGFRDAVERLSTTPIHAPVYYIVGGVNQGEGVVITRDRMTAVDQMYMNPAHGNFYVLETNYDNWTTPPPYDKERRAVAEKTMNALGTQGVNKQSMFNVISTRPVMNENTTYSMVMSASQPAVYSAWVRWP
ncbi:N-acylethanolamine-hydrolyzing acid amidase-like [Haliotis cracherodii]|uniref:N-acylethanolamine-hydrolyzing acid amidase-like n=1 Tax=Haliotis cracherodii TaxID=6455 RepID=UPI0039EA49B9